jgi:LysM repeat protein
MHRDASNPFRIPTCFERAEQLRRQNRFKKGVVAMVAAVTALLVILLVQGCMSEHAKTSANPASPQTRAVAANGPLTVSPAKPASVPTNPTLAATPAATPAPSLAPVVNPTLAVPAAAPVAPRPQMQPVYVVKPGDTLTRIARNYRTTVGALKSLNRLESDTIIVGATLKLPAA